MSAYLYALVTTDSRDDRRPRPWSSCRRAPRRSGRSTKRLGAWLAALGVDELSRRSVTAAEHRFVLQKAAEGAELQMSEAEESLAAELAPSGSLAWQRLHGDVSSQLIVEVPVRRLDRAGADGDGARPRHPSRRRRGAGPPTKGSSRAWETVAVPLAAALNGAKGELGVLNRRRGFADDLEPHLRANNVDRATLDAMTDGGRRRRSPTSAATSAPRRRLLGHDGRACRGGTCSRRSATRREVVVGRRDRARARRVRRLLARSRRAWPTRAFAERWVDAEIRDGKRGGAYCVVGRPATSAA